MNFPAFNNAAAAWRASGVTVFNPAENSNEKEAYGEDFADGNTTLAVNAGFDLKTAYLEDPKYVIEAEWHLHVTRLAGFSGSLRRTRRRSGNQEVLPRLPNHLRELRVS